MKILNYLLVSVLCLFLTSCKFSKQKLIPLFDGDTYLYFNSKGEVAVRPEVNIKFATPFKDGLALIGIETDEGGGKEYRYGFLNMKGELVIRPVYIYAAPFSEGLAWVTEPNGAPKVINKKGEEVFSMPEAENAMQFSEGVAVFSKKDKDGRLRYGFVDKNGKVVIEPFYDDASPFSNGLSAVLKDSKYGYINKKGEEEIPLQFALAGLFTDKGFAVAATSANHVGVINKKGVFVINPKYQDIMIDGDEFIVCEKDKCGIIDKNGKSIIPMDFKLLFKFGGKPYTMATLDEKSYGIIDREGKFRVNPQFDAGSAFIGDLAIVASGGSIGLIDGNGKYVVNPRYENAAVEHLISTDYYMVQSDFVDMDGIVAKILNKLDRTSRVGIDTYHQVKEEFGALSTNYTSRYHPPHKQYALADGMQMAVSFSFDGPVSKREYNYYERKYVTAEYNPHLKTAEYIISFSNDKVKNKSAEIAKAVDEALKKQFGGSGISTNATKSGYNVKINFSYHPINN